MSTAIDPARQAALNDSAMAQLRDLLQRGLDFVHQAYLPDLMAVAAAYREWTTIGAGVSNYLSFGDFTGTAQPTHGVPTGGVLPAGVIRDRNLGTVEDVDPAKIAEFATHSWFSYSEFSYSEFSYSDKAKGLARGTGSRPPTTPARGRRTSGSTSRPSTPG